MSFTINADKVFQDAEGIYFEKKDANPPHKLLGKVRPSELNYVKEVTTKIYVEKLIQSEESLENQITVFEQTLTISVPEEVRYKYIYLFKVQNGTVHLKDFDSGCTSAVSINDAEFVKRGKAKKLAPDTLLLKSAPIFTIREGVLERKLATQ
jgi:hypothetical protein